MAAGELSNVLDANEIAQLSEEIRNKFIKAIDERSEEIQLLKSKHEKLRVNSAQKYFEIEKQLITSNGKLEAETAQKKIIEEKLQELEKKFNDTTNSLQELQAKKDLFLTLEHEYKSTIHLLETEKRELGTVATKRSKDIERLNAEIEELTKKLTSANNEKFKAQVTLGELQSAEVSREYREKRLESEKAQLEQQVAWFNEQLTEKTNQLSSVRKEKTSNILELQSELEEKTQELTHQQSVVDNLKTSLEKQSERLEATLQKLREEREGQVQIEEQFRQELTVQKRLVTLYKAASDENDEQVTELTGAVEELRKMLKDSTEAYTELETKKDEETRTFEVNLKEKDEAVSKLQDELKHANELLAAVKKGSIPLSDSAVETLSPSAAATSRLLKSGMSLTQIYSEHVQTTEALREEKEENKRLNSYLEQIFQEIEERAPLMKKQREDYETALQNLEQMTSQLDSVMLESEKLRAENDDVKRKYVHMQRECSRYQQSCQDLSKQVQRLLKETEELRGGRVVREDMDVSSTEVSSSSIITEKLVTFRNIEELQKQNEKLIGVCRELSEKKEQEENEATTQKMQEMKEQLDFALSELDNLRDARARQAQMVESIVRQRDMYRVLLQQGGSLEDTAPMSQVTSTPRQPTQAGPSPVKATETSADKEARERELVAAREALKELKAEFDTYKKDRAENERLLNESSEKIKQNLADMRVSNTKLTTQLNFATERYKIVQDNVAGYKKEINLLQERNHLQSSNIHKHESAIAHLKEELMGSKENVARWQVQVENLRKEKELVKNAESRLVMELESIRREHTAQATLTASLQAIQNNLERSEFEAKTRHTNQVEGLERELAHLRRRLEKLLEEKTQQSTAWEDIVKNVHLELQHEKEKAAVVQTKADNAEVELDCVKQELSTCEAKLAAAETKLKTLATSQEDREEDASDVLSRVETEAVKGLKNQLAEQAILVKSLRQQLEAAKKHAKQYKTIADSVEQSMKQQTEVTEDVKKTCEKKIQEVQAEQASLEKRVELLEQDLEAANTENARLTSESSSLHGDLRKQVTSLQHELEEATRQSQEAVANSETAQQDCKRQAELATQTQDKYEREMMLHAADIEALAAVRKQLEDIQEHLQQTQEETSTYEKQLTDAKTSWAEQERVYKEEVKIVEARCDELTKQNTVLHEQMAKLSTQVVSIQQRTRRESAGAAVGANISFSEEQGKTSDQLLEVVKFLRRDKEIVETKLQVVQSECARVKQRLVLVEKQAEEAKQSLAEERQHAQVHAETAANQLDLMRKVSNFNVLSDSNKLLRDERDHLLNSKQELEAKIARLESDIEPLQAKLRDIESERDTLIVERDASQDEVNRWKNRVTNLIEQSNKTDPEEHKRLLQEKENLRKQLAQVREESFRHKNKLTRVNNLCTSQQTTLTNLKQEAGKASQELTVVKSQLEEKTKDCEQKQLTINRLKQIGRKYKEQADKINKELEDVKVKAAGQESDKVNVASLESSITELRGTITTSSARISTLEAQLTYAQNEAQAATKRAEQTSAENSVLKEAQEKKEEELTQSRNTIAQLQTEKDELNRKTAEFDRKTAEFDKKAAQSRQVMQSARTKIIEQQNRMRQLETEIAELKVKVETPDAVGTPASQDEAALRAQINQLQRDLEEARSDLKKQPAGQSLQDLQSQLEQLRSDNAELQAKVHQLQRQLEHKHSPSQQGSGASSGEAPKTANIKPMAPASSTSRQTAPSITSHTAHSSHSPAAVKATASIRPMAISPTTSSLPVSGTPTATVMPTTVSQTDVDTLPGPSGLQQSSLPAASVSGRVQIVEPQVMERNTDISSEPSEEVVVTNQAIVTPSVQQEAPAASPITQVVNPVTPTPAMPSTSSNVSSAAAVVAAAAVEVMPSQQQQQQQQQHTTGVALGKRSRDDDSYTTEETESKRTRMNTQDHSIPTITVLDENQQLVTQIQPQPSSSSISPPQPQQTVTATTKPTASAAPAVAASSTSTSWQAADSTRADSSNSRDDDVIMVLSDEDDQQVEDEDQAEDVEEEEYEDEDEEDEDEEEDEDIEEAVDPDEVEIIDGDETSEAQPSQVVSTGEVTSYRPSATLQPLSAAQPGERTQDPTRTQQIAPFMLATQTLMEEDDCTVPSTPTLAQPRRGDGFAEALNSPAVNQRFLFGADSGNNSELAQLESQRALGVDDTRMDLSQFDETGGRSMASVSTVIVTQSDSFPTESQEDADTTLQEAKTPNYRSGFTESQEDADTTLQEAKNPNYREGEEDQEEQEDDDLLEGDGDQEEEVVEEEVEGTATSSDPQASGEGSSGPSLVKEESEASSQEKPEGTAKPLIKKIVWDASSESSTGASSSSQAIGAVVGGTPIQPLVTVQTQPTRVTQGRAQGLRRGGPNRGRGGSQYWGSSGTSSTASRQGPFSIRPSRGGRGGFRGGH